MRPIAIAIHGGAGTIDKDSMTPELEGALRQALEQAALVGYQSLLTGGSALDAVVATVSALEDCEHFNAGKGSVLNDKEMVEMDASVMFSPSRQAGAVTGVRHIKNPVQLARCVLEQSPHVLLSGDGAETFAFERGFTYQEQDYFFTERRYQQLLQARKNGDAQLSENGHPPSWLSGFPDDKKYGTVGAVALDAQGHLAAATSTGGLTNKQYGRIGDSPLIGSGTWAEAGNVAVSTTGVGEFFICYNVASDVAARTRYLKEPLSMACERIIQGELKQAGGEGGLVALNAQGEIHFALNSTGMYRAQVASDGQVKSAIFADQLLSPWHSEARSHT
ncbi:MULTISPECIES: isoaspartyl peptidase/L-asparaginase family protein [unclassified Vibrio]|uniref:Isoaspartyl peptidase n=1 Tax=Vibrio sp. HB236076 TaxID=3232307 RepID=A0AB39HCX5_9VIBR|nr:isoaspartyl peptidase/L-asparaginase [Vibrio sp. HB161653]MDP5255331.1 isoaspartyl peptidase/L-asparaginase [Vibrio sp. HB161653]